MVREARFAWDADRPLPPELSHQSDWDEDESPETSPRPPVRRQRKGPNNSPAEDRHQQPPG